ncbi:UDP-N-acetylglucosamine 2-epimerase (non-hydrolyzing) [Pelagibacterales bacterium]|nr:UDP-N-acetylglucosamine 2-epimerase (non-hydrolyzing) [Pelagibacterales bacterium]
MLKIMTILGTRPELIKMCRVINEFDNNLNHILVHTGQNYDYELNQVFFEDLSIRKPDHFLEIAGETPAITIANAIKNSDKIIRKEKPDAIMIYGDTNSCLSVISAKRNKVPVFHFEAGNRCFDERVPEELNRKVVDHLSDINFVLTEHARRYLIQEGIKSDRIIKTGSHMGEVLEFYSAKIEGSKILHDLNLEKNKYFLVSIHREENIDDEINVKDFIDTLVALENEYNLPIIISTHPRTKKMFDNELNRLNNPNIRFEKAFGFFDYCKLQKESLCILSDSGTITEESSLLNLPAVTIRNSHERPEGMDEGTLIMCGLKKERVLNAVKLVISSHNKEDRIFSIVSDYKVMHTSKKILRAVVSYIDFINRNVWHKQ